METFYQEGKHIDATLYLIEDMGLSREECDEYYIDDD
jgi:hypothetical protein